MQLAYGFSHSADAAATFARSKAAGIGGRNFPVVSVWKLRDGMFQAFCQVCDDLSGDGDQTRQAGLSPDYLLRMLERYPWMLQRYPWVLERYSQMFKQAQPDGYNRTLH